MGGRGSGRLKNSATPICELVSRFSLRILVGLDSTGELLGESRRISLADQLFLNRHFVQNAQGFLESRLQLLYLWLSRGASS